MNIKLIDSQDVETRGTELLQGLDAILVRAASVPVVWKARL